MSSHTLKKDTDLPFVFINMAMTADGKIASTNGVVNSFGSPRDQAHLYELRAQADAVLCGARTVEMEGITLGPGGPKFQRRRLRNHLAEFNLRVIVSGSGSISPKIDLFKARFSPIIVLTTGRISSIRLRELSRVADEVKIMGKSEIDFRAAARWLRQKWNVKRLLCEGGGTVNGALFQTDLVDQIHLTICPKIFGGRHAPSIADGLGFDRLDLAKKFRLDSATRINSELFTVFSRR
jgi:riboflavin-specific deaminase-like protein